MTPLEIVQALCWVAEKYRVAYPHPNELIYAIVVVDRRIGEPRIIADLDPSQVEDFFQTVAHYCVDPKTVHIIDEQGQ